MLIYDGDHPLHKETDSLDITEEEKERMPHLFKERAVQKIYRFSNGMGASVVRGFFTFDMWELAVIQFTGPGVHDFILMDEPARGEWSDIEAMLFLIENGAYERIEEN
jgi:hypothetical protein